MYYVGYCMMHEAKPNMQEVCSTHNSVQCDISFASTEFNDIQWKVLNNWHSVLIDTIVTMFSKLVLFAIELMLANNLPNYVLQIYEYSRNITINT